jgi:hypothetical protein
MVVADQAPHVLTPRSWRRRRRFPRAGRRRIPRFVSQRHLHMLLSPRCRLRGFRPRSRFSVSRGRQGTDAPASGWPERLDSVIRLEGQDDQAIRQLIEAQVQSAPAATVCLGGVWPRVGLIVKDGRATRRTTPRHGAVLNLAHGPSARCSELHRRYGRWHSCITAVSRARHTCGHVSQNNELRAKFGRSVIRVDGKIATIAQNLATSYACSGEVGRENITVLA